MKKWKMKFEEIIKEKQTNENENLLWALVGWACENFYCSVNSLFPGRMWNGKKTFLHYADDVAMPKCRRKLREIENSTVGWTLVGAERTWNCKNSWLRGISNHASSVSLLSPNRLMRGHELANQTSALKIAKIIFFLLLLNNPVNSWHITFP